MAKEAKKTVTVFVPKRDRNDDALFVGINGKNYLIKKGESVNVPTEVAEVIENSLKAEEIAEKYITAVASK